MIINKFSGVIKFIKPIAKKLKNTWQGSLLLLFLDSFIKFNNAFMSTHEAGLQIFFKIGGPK